ncbi:MAG TPA: alpha-1,4-glucan--maltose-1-phosphate maltosyltransferase [Candidatus Contendobacter sp.]|nr:alpha-1,4-glucan--maltose-1-phosphate maltosyltransferase [Candidatus Contendobacter sp.]HRZ22501.1 alpha-1,4-glucan--maltose-1-phosphate maltosyltransferase [Candidatus Contendobacter sp.]
MSKKSLVDSGKQDQPEPSEKPVVAGAPKAAVAEPAAPPKSKTEPGGVDGRKRVIIEGVTPEIDDGRFPIKRTVGETVVVEADVFTDGHDSLSCVLQYRKAGDDAWQEIPMRFLVNDRWRGEFPVLELGRYEYTVMAWVDAFKSWRHDLGRWVQAEDIALSLRVGAELAKKASQRATGADARWLAQRASELAGPQDLQYRRQLGLDEEFAQLMQRNADRALALPYGKVLGVVAEDERARFSTWYEMFPRSCSPVPGKHGTFKDCEAWLPRIAAMGFDVLYFPPIHPVGRVNRKGKNNTLTPGPDDFGSPWAIGAAEGGHKAILPELGTLEDFRQLVQKAREHGIDIAMDIALQCAPDHPYVKQHPDWFRWRPDGTVQYAENPPKKYQDIYPFNFETDDWRALWDEIKSIFEFWIQQGVRIFRVDNPHTKPFAMWEWLIGEIKKTTPNAIFLAEAFTRPKVMHRLAKLGYTQSYTYYAWRNAKWELAEYLTELCQGPGYDYFRPNFWPNTPDILTEALQFGGRPMFMSRLVMAATMTANYGIYGPAYEMMEHVAVKHGSEEYLDSEKYQLRYRSFQDLDGPNSLHDFITLVNRIRKRNPALQSNANLCIHGIENEQIICYSKATTNGANVILVVVNLDPNYTQAGMTQLDLAALGVDPHQPFQVHDLLTGAHYLWNGPRNYVELNPHRMPAHIFRIRHHLHTERDFDTFDG